MERLTSTREGLLKLHQQTTRLLYVSRFDAKYCKQAVSHVQLCIMGALTNYIAHMQLIHA